MERGESVLDAIVDDDNLADAQDVEMMDIEEGEFVGQDSQTECGQNIDGDVNVVNQESVCKKRKRRNKKKKKKKKGKKDSSGPHVIDINRFVLDVCWRLKEKKTYLVYTAVGCLGVSALSDLVKEVDAIQACGGQKTADGRRSRNGGGIFWNILKTRDPDVFKEIMKKGREFEKQFRKQSISQGPGQNNASSPERVTVHTSTDLPTESASDGSQLVPCEQNELEQSKVEGKHVCIHERMGVPVTYDDLLGEENRKDNLI